MRNPLEQARRDAKRPRDKAGTKDALLRSALKLFSAHGYDATSVQEVALAAGVNVALISRYFEGKEGLLFAVLEQFLEQKQKAPLGYPPQASLAQEIFEYLRFRLREDNANAASVRLLTGQLLTSARFRDHVHRLMSGGSDENFRERLERFLPHRTAAEKDKIETIFNIVSLFSFSANLMGHQLLGRTQSETEKLFALFADAVSKAV